MSILSCVPNLCTLCVQHLLGTAPELPPQEGNEVQPRRIADALRGDRVCRSTVVWGDATRVTVTVSGTLGFGSVGSGTTVLLLPSPSPKTPCTLTEWCCMIQPGASTWTSLQSALNRTTWEFCKRKVLKENGLPSSPRACPSMVLSSCGTPFTESWHSFLWRFYGSSGRRSLQSAESRVSAAARAWNVSVTSQVYAENSSQAVEDNHEANGRAPKRRRRVYRKVTKTVLRQNTFFCLIV